MLSAFLIIGVQMFLNKVALTLPGALAAFLYVRYVIGVKVLFTYGYILWIRFYGHTILSGIIQALTFC